jgi:putative ABC transport system substrate-binding protein
VGFLVPGERAYYIDDFPRAMRDLGYEEGRNLAIDWRYANGQYDRLAALTADLVSTKPDVLVVVSTLGARAAKAATSTIPIVMVLAGDPVGTGLVASLARPGGNITGLSSATTATSTKWLELAKTVMPKSRVAVLANPDQPTAAVHIKNIQAAAQKLDTKVLPLYARTSEEIDSAFLTMTQRHNDAVIVVPDAFFSSHRKQIAQLAVKYRIGSITGTRIYAQDGALLSYGQDYAAVIRQAATYVDKIIKGAKPSQLPVEQPTIFELVVNLRTARQIGVTFSRDFLARVDHAIQ